MTQSARSTIAASIIEWLLEELAEHIRARKQPLVARIERLTVIFGATEEQYTADEYRVLLAAALGMLDQ